jgi:hypothetical protein
MKVKIIVIFVFVLMVSVSCSEPPIEGKVEIIEQEFSLEKDGTVWIINAKGTVKNVGEVDVKRVVVSGFCESCGDILTAGVWYRSVYEKEPHQKDIIGYIAKGAKEEFNFSEIAYYFDHNGSKPDFLPEDFGCKVLSFESIQEKS